MKTKKGSALLLSTILLFVVLALVTSLSYVTVMEQKMSSKTKSSVGSFFNADSGVEWALNKIANTDDESLITSTFGDSNIADGVPCPFPGCNLYFLDENGKVITDNIASKVSSIKAVRSVGTQTAGDPTQRAIEAAVGGTGGGGIYTRWGYDTCVGSDTKIYSGEGVSIFSGYGYGGASCMDGLLRDKPGYSPSPVSYIAAVKGALPIGTSLLCAVCVR